jgi:hypothetical protein
VIAPAPQSASALLVPGFGDGDSARTTIGVRALAIAPAPQSASALLIAGFVLVVVFALLAVGVVVTARAGADLAAPRPGGARRGFGK